MPWFADSEVEDTLDVKWVRVKVTNLLRMNCWPSMRANEIA